MVRFDFKVFCVNFSAYIMSENTKSGQDEVKVNDDFLEEGVITMKQPLRLVLILDINQANGIQP